MKTRLHAILAGHLTEMAKCHQAAMDASDEDSPAHVFHKGAMECCMKSAEDCVGHAKALKAAGMPADDELEPLPAGFARVASDAPAHAYRLAPRAGSPQIPLAPVVEAGFEHLVKIEGGE